MWGSGALLLLLCLPLLAAEPPHVFRPGRRVCALGAPQPSSPESFVQRVYQPFLTTCPGPRVCSTYRTLYRTAYRHSRPAPTRPLTCCPGWLRTSSFPGMCDPVCQPPCQNGGTCVRPGRCLCPAGWRGAFCQTDVDECRAVDGGCPQSCVNTPGSYWCQSQEGHCLPEGGPPGVTPRPSPGTHRGEVEEQVRALRSRVAVLEQKLQSVLAPLRGSADPGRLLAHSLRQLERIDSLSDQVALLEEQLGACSCRKDA